MFSANENILLRQHKRRVIDYIESTLPEEALDKGTVVMAMQVSCREPGCVPLETAITIVFPRPPNTTTVCKKKMKRRTAGGNGSADNTTQQQHNVKDTETTTATTIPSFPKPLVPNLEASRTGGNFKTRILKPLADVTQDDVLDALPPQFKGGRKTVESVCIRARDIMFAQIGQLMGNGNDDDDENDGSSTREGKKVVAEYLKVCLEEYMERECVAPEWGEKDGWGSGSNKNKSSSSSSSSSSLDEKKVEDGTEDMNIEDSTTTTTTTTTKSTGLNWGEGNDIVFKRPYTEDEDDMMRE